MAWHGEDVAVETGVKPPGQGIGEVIGARAYTIDRGWSHLHHSGCSHMHEKNIKTMIKAKFSSYLHSHAINPCTHKTSSIPLGFALALPLIIGRMSYWGRRRSRRDIGRKNRSRKKKAVR